METDAEFSRTLLIAGGQSDPNLVELCRTAQLGGVGAVTLLHGPTSTHNFCYELSDSVQFGTGGTALTIRPSDCSHYGLFLRHDVFSYLSTGTRESADVAMGWYGVLLGWAMAQPDLKVFNRNIDFRSSSKLYVLSKARQLSICTPRTVVTNDYETLERLRARSYVAKPVTGGSYCERLENALDGIEWVNSAAPVPAIVQTMLQYPEFRVFFIGPDTVLFRITSKETDHRTDRLSTITQIRIEDLDTTLLKRLRQLASDLGLDFCAFDLKSDPVNGEPVFLEVNTSPMFSEFNRVSSGAITDSMIAFLSAP